uniref:RNA polymerase sigma factor n=1 Tax=Acetatifactor sp. TaxID=1872090 RepID=UPI0040567D75
MGQIPLALEELNECIPSQNNVEPVVDDIVLTEIINHFLACLSPETRRIFVQRYWYLMSIKEIASDCNISASKVKVTLFRTRSELKEILEKEGIVL